MLVDNREQRSDSQPGFTDHSVKTSTSPCYFSDQEISDQVIKWLIVLSHLVTLRLSHCYFNVRSNSINEYACFFKQVLTLLEIINHDKISLSEVML